MKLVRDHLIQSLAYEKKMVGNVKDLIKFVNLLGTSTHFWSFYQINLKHLAKDLRY